MYRGPAHDRQLESALLCTALCHNASCAGCAIPLVCEASGESGITCAEQQQLAEFQAMFVDDGSGGARLHVNLS